MLKHLLVVVVFLFSTYVSVFSADNVWTLNECIEYALEHNEDVMRRILSEQARETELSERKWSFVPTLSASMGGTVSGGRVLDPTTYEFVETRYTSNTSASVGASIGLFEGGRKIYNYQRAKLNLEISALETEDTRITLKINVIAAFLEILRAEEQLKNAENTMSRYDKQLKYTLDMYEAGVITESDVLQIRAQIAAVQNDVSSIKNAYEMARLSLCDLLGIADYTTMFVIAPEEQEYLQYNVLDEIDDVINRQPAIKYLDKNLELAKKDIQIAKSAHLPSLSFSMGMSSNASDSRKKMVINNDATVSYEDYPFFQQYSDNLSGYASLNLSIPILAGRSIKYNVRRAKLNLTNVELAASSQKKTVRKQLMQAQISMNTAYEQYMGAIEQLKYAENAEMQLNNKYNLGAVDYNSWNNAVVDLASAQYRLSESKYSLLLRREILKIYAGE